jgi:phytoene synthase
MLDRSVAARRWDLYRDPFEDEDHLVTYLENTGGGLMWVAARALGAPEAARNTVRAYGTATALVRFLAAVPELESRGRVPLLDGRPEGVRGLARRLGEACPSRVMLKRAVPPSARPALREGWETARLLSLVLADPGCVAEGRLRQSEFRKRLALLFAGP